MGEHGLLPAPSHGVCPEIASRRRQRLRRRRGVVALAEVEEVIPRPGRCTLRVEVVDRAPDLLRTGPPAALPQPVRLGTVPQALEAHPCLDERAQVSRGPDHPPHGHWPGLELADQAGDLREPT